MIEMQDVGKQVDGQWHLSDISLRFESSSLNVLLGPTLAGKTSLMRLLAGLERPTAGTITVDGADAAGIPVQKRSVAMVYQQFINYQNLTVYENIASPLLVARTASDELDRRVKQAAQLLRLEEFLDRKPANLSGGQQQRTAIARALVKDASLVLLDEPLANLDYKLREELREEIPKIFADSGATFFYATAEPSEALLLGGNTVVMHQGRIVQFGETAKVFKRPLNLPAAQNFSDPPLNLAAADKRGDRFVLGQTGSIPVPADHAGLADGPYTIGLRPHHLSLSRSHAAQAQIAATVSVTELTGSESFIHVECHGQQWVILSHGVHDLAPGTDLDFYVDAASLLVFGADDATIFADRDGAVNGQH